jgi:hypothetical protein
LEISNWPKFLTVKIIQKMNPRFSLTPKHIQKRPPKNALLSFGEFFFVFVGKFLYYLRTFCILWGFFVYLGEKYHGAIHEIFERIFVFF